MDVIHSTKDYALVVLDEQYKESYPDSNYGVMNLEYQVIEATLGVLYAGYAVMEELQEKLDEARPKGGHLKSVQ